MQRRSFVKTGLATLLAGAVPVGRASAADLAGDMTILRHALDLHPGLHRYATPAQVAARLDALQGAFVGAATPDQRYLALSRFLATIRCGHSYANFFNQKKALAAALFDRRTRLPFHFVWLGDAMVVTADASGQLSPGTRIEAINGESATALRNRLLPYVRADGHNDGKRVSLLEVRGDDTIETFDVFQGLLAPPTAGVHRLVVRAPGGPARRIELPAIDLAERRKAMIVTDSGPDAVVWRWEMRPDGVALLTMPGWALYDSKWNWQAWLDERLDSLAGARGLIVDIRDNEGGLEEPGNAVLSRFIDRLYNPPQQQQRLRFRTTPADLDPYLDTWDDSFRTLGQGATPLPGGFFLRPGSADNLAVAPAGKRLAIPLVVLTSPVNSSATFQFASAVRTTGAGRLVGRTTGGNRRGINGGCFFFVRLPASGIEFDLPLVGYFPTKAEPDAGLDPDIAVMASAADIAAARDPVLDRAVATILRR